MNKDTENFLIALLWSYSWDCSELDEGDYTIYSFPTEFVARVEHFLRGFDTYLERYTTPMDIDAANNCARSFGGNVFFSLSGHGAGFWDESEPWGERLQKHLEAYAGNRYIFEGVDLFLDNSGALQIEGVKL
jgi:hypothetical protein